MPDPPFFNYMARAYIIYLPFVFALGAIVGSFLNVVIYRLPAGKSVIKPPSHCPRCKKQLRWYENLPIVGWIRLKGKCAYCKLPISIQYPLIELFCGLIFAGLFIAYFMVTRSAPVISELIPPSIYRLALTAGWPLYVLHVSLLVALLAMTLIDFRTLTIPIEITWVILLFAVVVHTIMPIWPAGNVHPPLSRSSAETIQMADWTIPLVGPTGLSIAIGALFGIAVAWYLLRKNQLRYSFLDFNLFVGEHDDITAYPHPRREMQWELDYLGFIIAGMYLCAQFLPELLVSIIGISDSTGATTDLVLPLWAQGFGGCIMGYIVGAGLIWAIRFLGTLAFGKEAMGLGDAHLLGCVGAVTGWVDPIAIFFLAPFLALFGIMCGSILGKLLPRFQRILPYGPWLALATVCVMFGDKWFEQIIAILLGNAINFP